MAVSKIKLFGIDVKLMLDKIIITILNHTEKYMVFPIAS